MLLLTIKQHLWILFLKERRIIYETKEYNEIIVSSLCSWIDTYSNPLKSSGLHEPNRYGNLRHGNLRHHNTTAL